MENSLKNQLEGFLRTPPLWNNSELLDIQQFKIPEISIPDNSEIHKNIPDLSTNFVLGKRIESYFAYILQLSTKFRILAENIQIRRNKITLGEIDFLVEDQDFEEQIHIEVVYKFYVYDPALENELQRWIGPNRKDSLPRKLKKLQDHQFPMLFNPETAKTLKPLNLRFQNLQQQVCFKAQLFIPKDFPNKGFPYINNNCISGYWITYDEFDSEDYSTFKYYAPKKQDWPVDPENNHIWYSFEQIKIQILDLFSEKKSPLIWIKKPTAEYEKFFVVWW